MSHFSTPIWFQYFSTAWTEWLENVGETNERTQFWVLSRKDESHPVKPAGRHIAQQLKRQSWLFEERRYAIETPMQTQVAPTCVSCWHVDVPIRDKRSRQHWDWDSWPTLELARLTSKHYDTQAPMISAKSSLGGSFPVPHIQKSKTPSHWTHACVFVFSKFHVVLFLYVWCWWRV